MGSQRSVDQSIDILAHKGMGEGGLKAISKVARSLFAKCSKTR